MEKITHPKIEEGILKFWKDNKIFEKSLKKSDKEFVFYDGPPFATGTPHYGHIVASLMKDVVPRYWTMKGYRVERKWGWDCHGLPIENIVEKEMKTKSKKDIEKIGVEKFNKTCCSKVLKYTDDWKKTISRLGRWADMDNAYKTMDLDYMETVWWVFKQLWDKGLIYEDYKSMHICPRCETTLSQSEVTEGYKDIKDLTATVKFELEDEQNTFVLAWTTTPWTLPGNVALAVGGDIDYSLVQAANGLYIIASDLVGKTFTAETVKVKKEFKGKDLVGKKYKPLFPYYESSDLENKKNLYTIQSADFVTTEEGTGVVHIAPAFGEDDMNLAKEKKLPFIQHVTMDGIFKDEVKDFKNLHVKPKGDPKSTDKKIIEYLDKNKLLFSQDEVMHSYPHCWRCDTPLLNYATSSWFVNVTKIKPKALKLAKQINWSPAHIKEGRFGKWLEGARDWSISRQRFWASVIPIWKCSGQASNSCDEIKVFGSIDELRKESNKKITKLIFVRHGESEKNILNIKSRTIDKFPLTQKGEKQIRKLASKISGKIDLIISSPVLRARQTAEILAKKVGAKVVYDDLIIEYHHGTWEDLSFEDLLKNSDYIKYKKIKPKQEKFNYKLGKTGETRTMIVKRVASFIKKVGKEHAGKNILIVSHAGIKTAINKVLGDISLEQYFILENNSGHDCLHNFYINENGETFDLHKHVIDKIEIPCKCGRTMKRIPDVLDCWFESASMPYAQKHYPFNPDSISSQNSDNYRADNKKELGLPINFPAEFIAEGSDQARAWFYYLHIIATALFEKSAFKNVIVNGIVLAKDGKKMSKRLQNYPEPDLIVNKYGADAIRFYLLSSPVMAAENINFTEDGVKEAYQKVVMMISNVFAFYQMYVDAKLRKQCETIENAKSDNVLDKWIIAKLNLLVKDVACSMDSYDLIRSVRPIQEFINELSTWYVRRSRDRFKNSTLPMAGADKQAAIATLREVLSTLSKVMAPFTPFIAEHIYKEVDGEKESVHLVEWPVSDEKLIDKDLISQMEIVRQIASLGLEKRASETIPVRQPLAKITVFGKKLNNKKLENLIKDELNILEVKWDKPKANLAVELDTKLTPELEAMGIARDLTRQINNLRKQKGLTIKDRISIVFSTDSGKIKSAINSQKDKILTDTLADGIKEAKPRTDEQSESGARVKIKGEVVKLEVKN